MKIKSAPLQVKAAGEDDGLEDGQFIAYASVFGGPPDSYGDVVDKGAFAKSLAKWESSGDPIPLLWGHDFADPFSNLGHIVEADEDEHGLKVRGEFDLENPTAQQVYRLIKGRRTTDLSFAYDIIDAEFAEDDDTFHLKELDIFEVSIVPIGANRFTDVVAVKHLADGITGGLKAGRKLSAQNERALREARDSIDSVLESLGDDQDEESEEESASGSDSDSKSQASREQRSVGGDESKSAPSVDLRALEIEFLERKHVPQTLEGAK